MPDLVAAEFESAELVVAAAKRVRALGYADIEAYTPFPVVELDDALARPRPKIPVLVLLAGITGGALALLIQWWTAASDYPLDVGGRPHASWPTYIPIIFESTVLLAGATSFFSVLLGSKLPRLHDPIFDLPNFERSTVDRFWLTVIPQKEIAGAELRTALDGAVEVHGL